MNLEQIDSAFRDYVGEKNRRRIQEEGGKRPMFSSPVSLWRGARSVDDIRRDMINKISVVLVGGEVLHNLMPHSVSPEMMGVSVAATGLTVSCYQLSKIYNNAAWKIIGNQPPALRILSGSMGVIFGLQSLAAIQLFDPSPAELVALIKSIIFQYIQFHLLFTNDVLPKRPDEKIQQNRLVYQV